MWAILRQEEIRRITKKQNISGGTVRVKKEEEDDATLVQGKENNKGRRRGTFPRFGALTVVNLDTSPALVLRRRTKELLIPRLQQKIKMALMMMQP